MVLMQRKRLFYGIAVLSVIITGLASRKFSAYLPGFIADYAGDTLWALMVFLLIGFVFRNISTGRAAAVSLLFSYSIELSQFYQAPWINSIRHTRIGGLVLGFGFLWSDIFCYTTGITIGAILEKYLLKSFPVFWNEQKNEKY